MTKKVFYERVGRRYIPVAEYNEELMDAYPFPKDNSAHVVVRAPGSTMRRFNVDADIAPLIAAGMVLEESMVQILTDTSAYPVPSKEPLTPEQVEAWAQMKKAFNGLSSIRGKSLADVARDIMNMLAVKANEINKTEATKKAFEEYVLLSKLSN